MAHNAAWFEPHTTRSGREFSAFGGPIASLSTGHDFGPAVRSAARRDEDGLGSPTVAPLPELSPAPSAASFDVPRTSSPLQPDSEPRSPSFSPATPASPYLIPCASPNASGPPSPALSSISLESFPDYVGLCSDSEPELLPDEEEYSSDSEPEPLPCEDEHCTDSEPESLLASSAPSSPAYSQRSLSPLQVPGTKKRKRRAGDNAAFSKRRLRKRQSLRGLPTDLTAPSNPHQESPLAIPTEVVPETHFPVVSTGYTAERVDTIQPGEVWLVEELIARGFEVFHWDGITPYAILDNQRRIVGVLAGRPTGRSGNTAEWDAVTAGLEQAIDDAQAEMDFTSEDMCHRRGAHTAKAFGLSHGNGQTKPCLRKVGSSKAQEACNQAVLQKFRETKAVQRFAGFASSAMSYYSPKLYERYCDYMGRLAAADPAIRAGWNFPNSVFPCTTINFGPSAVCYDHLDFSNAAAGWCSISCAGTFDPTKGGHLVLFDIDRIIEFPPGSTILIPSSVMRHGNTPVQAGEKRVGMTQYAAGGLFRWVDNGFQKATVGKKSTEEREEAEARFSHLLTLYSRIEELASDRAKVFNRPCT
ncbi:hypothetical protein HWV62_31157 [Athelia sp. TMB]|nr:hypothetical protein HWV62_31157 [Athelia sp. TMB]